jgi:hypothetical protein
MDTSVINQDPLHLKECSFARSLVVVFDKGILQAVACLGIPYNLAAQNLAKTTKNELQVFVSGDWV